MQKTAFSFFRWRTIESNRLHPIPLKSKNKPAPLTMTFFFSLVDAVIVVQQCDQGTARNRSRHVLRLPASENSACPEPVQSEPCVLNSTCFSYQYKASGRMICTSRLRWVQTGQLAVADSIDFLFPMYCAERMGSKVCVLGWVCLCETMWIKEFPKIKKSWV